MITVCTVESVEYSVFDILLCKSAIRRLFFPSCSIAVFCTLSPLFIPFGDSGFRLLGVRLKFMFISHLLFGRGRLPVVGQS